MYLAATTHLVTTNQVPFPSTYYAAYGDSEEIYVEVDEPDWWGECSRRALIWFSI